MKWSLTSLAVAAVALSPIAAYSAGPFDGTWQVDAAGAGASASRTTTGRAQCEPVRLQFNVKDNQIESSLARSPQGGNRVTQTDRNATPISGTVQPDGTVNAEWQNFKVTGKLTGDKAELQWNGQCGPRVATGGRIASTEGAGSTTGTR